MPSASAPLPPKKPDPAAHSTSYNGMDETSNTFEKDTYPLSRFDMNILTSSNEIGPLEAMPQRSESTLDIGVSHWSRANMYVRARGVYVAVTQGREPIKERCPSSIYNPSAESSPHRNPTSSQATEHQMNVLAYAIRLASTVPTMGPNADISPVDEERWDSRITRAFETGESP